MPLSETEEFELLSLERERAGITTPAPSGGRMTPKQMQIGAGPPRTAHDLAEQQHKSVRDFVQGVGDISRIYAMPGGGYTLAKNIGSNMLAAGKEFLIHPLDRSKEILAQEASSPFGFIGGPARGMSLADLTAAQATRATPPAMAGVGAAMTDMSRLRMERAQQLPVPLELTKGMATRDFGQQRFERETAKLGKVGEPIRERHAQLNEGILKNFDAWVDQTGAEAGSLRATGELVNKALVDKANKAKGTINAAYEQARQAGEMERPVAIKPLQDYVKSHKAEAINAPIINSLGVKLNQISKRGKASVNDLEELRKMIGNLSGSTPTNTHFGKEIKSLIDATTEGAGGGIYQRARKLRSDYAKEFENVGVIDKLMSTKPGTTDRSVAYEDVFSHSILKGSLDDVRQVRRTLQTAGDSGQQAWKELQGRTVEHLKEAATRSVQSDIRGNPVVSAAGLSKAVREMDKDGKLDFIFGKHGAQQIRDIEEVTKDIMTFPPGSVNTSHTASVLLEALGSAAMGRIPTAAAQTIKFVKDMRQNAKTRGMVQESLNPNVSLRDIAQGKMPPP